MADLKFRVKAHIENPTKTIVKARGFELVIDEPADLGGTNEGANPVEFMLAAFAGCINVMAHVVAGEMKMNLKGVEINISGNLNPERLFGTSFEDRAGYKGIDVVVKADTDASEETIAKWLKAIEDRCPVSDNLRNATPVTMSCKVKKQACCCN